MEKYFKTPIAQQNYKEASTRDSSTNYRRRRSGVSRLIVSVGQILTKIMLNAKKILITTESHEIYVLRNTSEAPLRSYCSECSEETEFLTIDDAVCTSRVSTIDLVDLHRLNRLHTAEAASGHLLVCHESLKTIFHGEK